MYVYKMSETLVTPRVNYILSPLGAMHNTCFIEAHLSQYWWWKMQSQRLWEKENGCPPAGNICKVLSVF